ncbi:lipid II:glycine glycyltransferase FemX [Pseudarthrobacter sp. P1]|uniref:lipid II:glycine glycyltransferase FemX n=1 Tax=Pseudarthrobacter sp. P1 TaxID=3418418 RepID=UPI003CF9A3C0
MTLSVEQCTDRARWDGAVEATHGHPLQLWGWGQTKANHGWKVERVLVTEAGAIVGLAQVLLRTLPFPFKSLAYIPRGPQAPAERITEVLDAVAGYVKGAHGSVVLSVEPDWEAGDAGSPVQALEAAGFVHSENQILIPRTLILDLAQTPDELLAAMHKKHRQNIRKATRDDLDYRVVARSELPEVMAIYRATAERAGFGLHEDAYYAEVHDNYGAASEIHGAYFEGRLVAFLWHVASATTSFEIYSGATVEGQKLNVNYALKWFSIQRMQERGVLRYDLDGLLNDGISEFKKMFGKHENLLVGSWDKPLSPLYPLYTKALPLAKKVLRKIRGLLKR